MGEYAKRLSDGQQVKIGTCEQLYYCRYSDRDLVDYNFGDCEFFWRLPFPDEDCIAVGDYQPFERGCRLYRHSEEGYCIDFSDETTVGNPGVMQMHNDSGLLVNVKCYHGEKLPEASADLKAFWNGKGWFYELIFVKNTRENGLLPVVRCRFCGEMWRYQWSDILPFVQDSELKERLVSLSKEHCGKVAV